MPDTESILLLDGATGTELDRHGVDISLPLWSTRALIEAPDVLQQVHRSYLEAGATAITTNTFRTHRRTLNKAGIGDRACELTTLAVQIARAACDDVNTNALVFGSIAPLEDCYRPDLAPDESSCRAEHREIMQHLLDAGVDLLLIETMNNLTEARAAATEAQQLAPGKWILSCCMKNTGPPGVLLSGEPIAELLEVMPDAYAIGINCVAAPNMEAQVKHLRNLVGKSTRICAYANIGYADDVGNWINTDAINPKRYADYALRWIDAGATIIGGCCGTTPQTIRAIRKNLAAQR